MSNRGQGGYQASPWLRGILVLVLGLVLLVGRSWLSDPATSDVAVQGEEQVLELYASETSGEVVLVSGEVQAVLPDDNDGSRHQRFIVALGSGHTLLVAHNIDLAPRVPLSVGDAVQVRGEYEWNDRGGVLHWTHDDPNGDHPGGWIEWGGERYH